ncbi:hypothetical protein HKX48_004479 [Thoreauomyces humboldtii]|nr:hypothetical protein HKX48_004479 [Thoreauomyces humboldtii]
MARILHLAFDAVLLSTVVSGAKRAAGVEFDARKIENETLRTAVQQYFNVGDFIINYSATQLKKQTDYFVPVITRPR